jgi:hypothetical protein
MQSVYVMNKICIVLIPVYRDHLTPSECRNISHSLGRLASQNCLVSWLAPSNIDKRFYEGNFPSIGWSLHLPEYFRSISAYSRLLLSDSFYEEYSRFEFMLILQPDAVILTPTLNDWLKSPYDYIGAPWPNGWEYGLPVRLRGRVQIITCRAFVGNGGLSLRRPRKIVQLLREFPEARATWCDAGNPEDLLISMLATLSPSVIIPTIGAASRFSLELEPDFFCALFNDLPPFGLHGNHEIIGKFIERHYDAGLI